MKPEKTLKRKRADDAPLTDEELKTGRKLSGERLAMFKRVAQRGRPVGRSKEVTSVSFDQDVLAELRKHKGWQTWLNALAKAALGLERPQDGT
jgi:uncharacterized protein (DUF4415 family)